MKKFERMSDSEMEIMKRVILIVIISVSIIGNILLSAYIIINKDSKTVTLDNVDNDENNENDEQDIFVPELSIPEQIQNLYEQLDSFKLPIRNEEPLVESYTKEELMELSKPQLILTDDPTAYLLAAKLRPFVWSEESNLSDFTDIMKINLNSFRFIALKNTPKIAIGNDYKELYPNHIITQFILRQEANRRTVDEMYYISDLQEKLIYYFGGENETLLDISGRMYTLTFTYAMYEVHLAEQIIAFEGAYGSFVGYPQIITYEKTDTGYVCEAVIISQHYRVTIDHIDIDLTTDNINDYTNLLAKYRFTFTEAEDGRLILSSQEKLQNREVYHFE